MDKTFDPQKIIREAKERKEKFLILEKEMREKYPWAFERPRRCRDEMWLGDRTGEDAMYFFAALSIKYPSIRVDHHGNYLTEIHSNDWQKTSVSPVFMSIEDCSKAILAGDLIIYGGNEK